MGKGVKDKLITAHSGSDGYIDNSREFIEAMLESGVEAFEIDCQISDNQRIYLGHDEVEDTQNCLGLDDVFQLMSDSSNQTIIMNIDCKNNKIGPLAISLAKKYSLVHRIVLSGSLSIEDYDEVHRNQLFYNIDNSLPFDENTSLYDLEIVLDKLRKNGITVIQSFYGLVNQEIVDVVKKFGIKLSVWTVNEEDLIDDFLKLGCFNVTTRVALQYLNKK